MAEVPKTRSAKSHEEDEKLIQRVIEKIFVSEKFLSKLINKISEVVAGSVENTIKVFVEKVEQLDKKIINVSNSIDDQEQFLRRNNLRIYGLSEERNEDIQERVINLFQQKLDVVVNPNDIDFCYRLKSKEGTNRPVMVRFCRHQVKQEIFKRKSKFKGTKIVIKEDLTVKRLSILKQACVKFGPKNVWSSDGKVCCKVNNKFHKLVSLTDLEKIN